MASYKGCMHLVNILHWASGRGNQVNRIVPNCILCRELNYNQASPEVGYVGTVQPSQSCHGIGRSSA